MIHPGNKWWLLLVAGALWVGTARAQEAEAPENAPTFRRVLVPEARLADVPRDEQPYVPVSPEEFERLVRIAGEKTAPAQGARIVGANYRGRLNEEQVLIGDGELQIQPTGDFEIMIPFDHCNVAITKAQWVDDGSDATLVSDGKGRLGLLTTRGGDLHVEWRATGQRDSRQRIAFALQLPAGVGSKLTLELGRNSRLRMSEGVTGDALIDDRGAQWPVWLSGTGRASFLIDMQSDAATTAIGSFKQQNSYEIAPRGIDFNVRMQFTSGVASGTRLQWNLPQAARAVSARWGELPAGIEQIKLVDDNVQYATVVPTGGDAAAQVLTIQATAPLPTEGEWQLPRLQLLEAFWEEGVTTLRVIDPLAVGDLKLISCSQRSLTPLAQPQSGENFTVQEYGPQANLRLQLTHRTRPWRCESGTSIWLGIGEIEGEWIGLGTTPSRASIWEWEIGTGWEIDAVTSDPAETLSDWSVLEGNSSPRLQLVLAAPRENNGRALKLRVAAHRPWTDGNHALSGSQMRIVSRTNLGEPRRLLTVAGAPEVRVDWQGLEFVERLGPADLSANDLQLISPRDHGLTFVDDPLAIRRLSTQLAPQTPPYDAEITTRLVALAPGQYREEFAVRCKPAGAPVDSILIGLTETRGTPLEWSRSDAPAGRIRAERASRESLPPALHLASTVDLWWVRCEPPLTQSTEVRAVRQLEFPRQDSSVRTVPLCFVAAPLAVQQGGIASVDQTGGFSIQVQNQGLEPTSARAGVAADSPPQSTISYHYHPATEIGELSHHLTVIAGEIETLQAAPVIWSRRVDSWFGPDGSTQHVTTWIVERTGSAHELGIEFPKRSDLLGAWFDGEAISTSREEGVLKATIPGGFNTGILTVGSADKGPQLGLWSQRSTEFPKLGAAVPTEWFVWLPQNFEVKSADDALGASAHHDATLSERLVGVLGLRRSTFAMRQRLWHNLPFWSSSEPTDLIAQREAALLVVLDDAWTDVMTRRPANWGRFWQTAESRLDPQAPKLLVDETALSLLGIRPETPLPERPVTGAPQIQELMQQAGLTLIAHPEGWVVSSRTAAANLSDELVPTESRWTLGVREGRLYEELTRAFRGRIAPGYATVLGWTLKPRLPWTSSNNVMPDADVLSWNAQLLTPANDSEVELTILDARRLWVLSWGLCLGVAGWFAWRGTKSNGGAISWLLALAALAIVAPIWLMPLTTAVFQGCVLGILLHGLIRWGEPQPGAPHSARRLSHSSRVRVGLFLVGVAVYATMANGAEPDASQAVVQPKPHQVLIPVDELQQPTGQWYQVPVALDGWLRETADEREGRPRQGLLTGAEYRLTLGRSGENGEVRVERLSVRFDLQIATHQHAATLPLRLLNSDSVWVARCDGEPISVEASADFQQSLPPLPMGNHHLEFELIEPEFSRDNELQLQIPRTLNGTLQIEAPESVPEFRCATATGFAPSESGLWRGSLVPSELLTVTWNGQADSPVDRRPIAMEQLDWLQVQPGSILVTSRFRAFRNDANLNRVRVSGESRLSPLRSPADSDDSPAASESLWIEPEALGPGLVQSRWLATGGAGIGRLQLPTVLVQGAEVVRHWVAVTVDPRLQYSVESLGGYEVATPAELSELWQEEMRAQLLYRVPVQGGPWTLVTQPLTDNTTAGETLEVSFAEDALLLAFTAELTHAGLGPFEYRLNIPAELAIEGVELEEADTRASIRWVRAAPDRLHVFVGDPREDQQRLRVQGRIPISREGNVSLPMIGMRDCQLSQRNIKLFRTTAQRIELVDQAGLQPSGEPLTNSPEDPRGRMFAAFTVISDTYHAEFRRETVPQAAKIQQVLALRREGTEWGLECALTLERAADAPDALDLPLPPNWQGPFEIDPPWPHHVTAGYGDRPARLLIQVPLDVTDQAKVVVRGPLKSTVAEPPSISPIEVRDVNFSAQYIVIPTQSGVTPLTWEADGLVAAELPAEWQNLPVAAETFAAYRATRQPCVIRPQSRNQELAKPRVQLADIYVTYWAARQHRGLMALDLDPGGAAEVLLDCPTNCELDQVSLDGRPAIMERVGQNQWKVALTSRRLTQRLEVVFRCDSPAGAWWWRDLPIAVPTLSDAEVERCVWTVALSDRLRAKGTGDATSISPLRAAMYRLAHVSEILQTGAEGMASLPPAEKSAWYRRWALGFVVARQALRREILRATDASLAEQAKTLVLAMDEEQLRVAQQLGMEETLAQLGSQVLVAASGGDFWRELHDHQSAITFVSSGSNGRLALTISPRIRRDLIERTSLAGALILAIPVARSMTRRHGWWSRGNRAHGVVWLVLGGLACYWLTPGWIGLVLMGYGLLCLAWPGRPRREPPSVPRQEIPIGAVDDSTATTTITN
jgi:hypothetical protein